ncbi:hypothetical protein C8R45DRAFT_1101216 [Mycena sanguinolenta]|nr:hypothetical protein C8R45DRAFT_1101216 [Mycena sanguinolenta]
MAMRKKAKAKAQPTDVLTHTHNFSLEEITGQTAPEAPIMTYVDRVSHDNRRHYRNEVEVVPPSPVKRAQLAAIEATSTTHAVQDGPNAHTERYQMSFDDEPNNDYDVSLNPTTVVAPKVVKPSDPALHRFCARRDEYLRALLYHAGRMRADFETCRLCSDVVAEAIFRCQDCFGDEMICQQCCVDRHVPNLLHRMERWNRHYFEMTSLKALGLRAHSSFVILHTNGLHEVAVDVCDCEHRRSAGPPEIQMLRAGWFPATDDRPRTCATLACLDLFVLNTSQAKTTAYDFYKMLEKLTNNTGAKVANRYQVFLRMSREYRHLLMLKQGGRGHEAGGVVGTRSGELAVVCPCCPRPEVNLPADWQTASPEDAFLYIVFLAIDACFRLKRRLVSSELKDPPLSDGWAYMVKRRPYREYLLTVTDQKEMSTCSGLAALDHTNTKFSWGYSATGVGMGVCACHEFVQPNGVSDLQRGERYANMDYIFTSILCHIHDLLCKIVSYDIVCQWWKTLKARLMLLSPLVRIAICLNIVRFVIPKMHIKGHLLACVILYSLNFVPGSAQTDGEGIERPWANIGGVASSTREMGPGAREDVLNCHWGFWNWQKLVGMAERLRTRRDRADVEYAAQMEAFTTFSMQQAAHVPSWRMMVENYEANPKDPKNKNPYEMMVKGLMEAQVLLKLEQEEAQRVAAGVPTIHRVSPSSFVMAGLAVEEEQRRVRVQVELKKAQTTAQQIDVVALRRDLARSLRCLRVLQATYTPAAIVELEKHDGPEEEPPENVPLFLPSALPAHLRKQEPLRSLAVIENDLCDAQLASALASLRVQLHVKDRLFTYKALQARNQGANTRAREIVNRNETKIRLHSEKYQMAWEAKRRLEGGDAAKVGWRVLRAEDIRGMEEPEDAEK